VREFRILAGAAAVLAAAALCGCRGAPAAGGPTPPLLEDATATYLAGDNLEAIRLYSDFLRSRPSGDQAAQAYLGRGHAYYGLSRWRLAEADFENARKLARDRSVKAQATLGLAHTAFAQDRYGEAEKIYMEVLRSHKGYVPQDETMYRLGIALARQGQWEDAAGYLQEVLNRWPDGEFARLAKAKLPSVLERHFTVQVGAFTKRPLAEARLEELAQKGFQGEIVAIEMDGVPGYAVRSGRLSSWVRATSHAVRLEAAGFSTYALP